MKFYVAVAFLMSLGVSMAIVLGDGKPACTSPVEMATRTYRNLWDPTLYWECVELGQPAIKKKCPDGTAFDDVEKKCVDWELWSWTDPIENAVSS